MVTEKQPQTIDQFLDLIKSWHDESKTNFATQFERAIVGVKPRPIDIKDEVWFNWTAANITTLQTFFRDWYNWNPHVSDGLERIQQFSWLYYQNEDGRKFVTEPPGLNITKYFVVLNAKKYDDPASVTLVKEWIEEMGEEGMKDFKHVAAEEYKSFNDFFIRELKDLSRNVSSPSDDSLVVSPADAVVNMLDNELDIDRPLNIKTRKLSPRQLLNDSPLAESFKGGTALSCILMPDVYHRYHSPVTGKVVESKEEVAGSFFGIDNFHKLVNGCNVGNCYYYSVFEHFHRGYLIIETRKFGHVAMVPVGLNTINSIVFKADFKSVTSSDEPVNITKGDEVGLFKYGGSLIILLFEAGVYPSVRIPVRQGIGKMMEKAKIRDKPQFRV